MARRGGLVKGLGALIPAGMPEGVGGLDEVPVTAIRPNPYQPREHFGPRVYQTVVPRTVRLSEAPSFGQPIILFDPTSRGAVAYRELAKEVSSGATRRTG